MGLTSRPVLELLRAALGVIRSANAAYGATDRFVRIRAWIVACLVSDLVATVAYVLIATQPAFDLVVWFEAGFPANLLIVRNEADESLEDVILVLDDRYAIAVDKVEPGLNGYDVHQAFRDAQERHPPDAYRPSVVEIRVGGKSRTLPIGKAHGSAGE